MVRHVVRPWSSWIVHFTVPIYVAWALPPIPLTDTPTAVGVETKSSMEFVIHLEQQLSIAIKYESVS